MCSYLKKLWWTGRMNQSLKSYISFLSAHVWFSAPIWSDSLLHVSPAPGVADNSGLLKVLVLTWMTPPPTKPHTQSLQKQKKHWYFYQEKLFSSVFLPKWLCAQLTAVLWEVTINTIPPDWDASLLSELELQHRSLTWMRQNRNS